MKTALWLCTSALLLASCQPVDSDRSQLSQVHFPILGGVPDHSAAHQAVVLLGTASYVCSGTLISPTIVMTAGHCADYDAPGAYTVYFGDDVHQPTDTRAVAEVTFHPDYDSASITNDIALVRLANPAPSSAKPIPYLPASLALTSADLGITLTFVGFGKTDANDSSSIGVKYTVSLPLYYICETLGGCMVALGADTYSVAQNTLSYDQRNAKGICSGDSGGPAFINRTVNGTTREYVAGVTSAGYGNCSLLSMSTKVDAYETWINDFIGSFSLNGQQCMYSSECYSGFCVEGVCCNSLCDQPCMTCKAAKAAGTCQVAGNGFPCPDADPCNGAETCQTGVCTATAAPLVCTSSKPCVTSSCVTGVGCSEAPAAEGSDCDNHNQCDGADKCVAGTCKSKGVALDCDDDNLCTEDLCDPISGCLHNPMADGTACADADKCNGAETCQAGVCKAAAALSCDDKNACTVDSCAASSGCAHTPMAEGDTCGDGRTCQGGLCQPKPSGGGGCAAAGGVHPPSLLWALLGLGLWWSRPRRFR